MSHIPLITPHLLFSQCNMPTLHTPFIKHYCPIHYTNMEQNCTKWNLHQPGHVTIKMSMLFMQSALWESFTEYCMAARPRVSKFFFSKGFGSPLQTLHGVLLVQVPAPPLKPQESFCFLTAQSEPAATSKTFSMPSSGP